MKKLSESHKKAIGLGVIKAYEEGRHTRDNNHWPVGLQAIAELHHEEIMKRAAKAGSTMRGRPQRLDAPTGAHKDNVHAKEWELVSPDNKVYRFKNLNQFLRDNSELFDEKDLNWKGGGCNAGRGLRTLFYLTPDGKPRLQTWKGWHVGERFD